MGGGTYNFSSRSIRSLDSGYNKVTADNVTQTFVQRMTHETLDPKGVIVRESRDSEEHPNSLAILIGIDVTGSMGMVPAKLISDGMPTIIGHIFAAGIKSPQVGFLAIGDHKTDNAPLQIGQFESSDELMDESLVKIYLEGHGGGNGGESYLLAWYHAAFHTSIDCFEKRGQKGVLITIGDERTHKELPSDVIRRLYGKEESKSFTASELLVAASKTFDVYHIHVCETYNGSSDVNKRDWREILGEQYFEAQNSKDLPDVIAKIVALSNANHSNSKREETVVSDFSSEDQPQNPPSSPIEPML